MLDTLIYPPPGPTSDPAGDFYKNHLESSPPSPMPLFWTLRLCKLPLWVLLPPPRILQDAQCMHRRKVCSLLFPTLSRRGPSPAPTSAFYLLGSQQLHVAARSHSKSALPGPPLGTLLHLCSESGEEKMLTQAAQREHNCCGQQVLGVLASPGVLQRPCVCFFHCNTTL